MALWLILFLKLCIVQICFCDFPCWYLRPSCESELTSRPEIKLLIHETAKVNKTLLGIYQTFQDEVLKWKLCADITFKMIEADTLKDLVSMKIADPYLIHLTVEDFYQTNYADIESKFIYAGNIENTIYRKCIHNVNVCSAIDLNNRTETCDGFENRFGLVKLVSRELSDCYPEIHEFVNNFLAKTSKDSITKYLKIVVCRNIEYISKISSDKLMLKLKYFIDKIYSSNVPIPVIDVKNKICPTVIEDGTIAILAPEPYDLLENASHIPIIFYEQINLPKETTDIFTNSFTEIKEGVPMEHLFIKFLKRVDWNRVAIISDDHEDSMQFVQNLTPLLDKENIAYWSRTCEGLKCDFTKALKSLVKPNIIIANVREENADKLAEQFSKVMSMTRGLETAWLARGWSIEVASQSAEKIGDVYSITLGPRTENPSLDNISTEKIMKPLKLIVEEYKNKIKQYNWENKEHLQWFADQIKRNLHSDSIAAYVIKSQRRRTESTLIASMTIDPLSLSVISYNEIEPVSVTLVVRTDCTFVSNDYTQSCRDLEFILIMLVAGVFFVTLLAIICFFDERVPYSRMAC